MTDVFWFHLCRDIAFLASIYVIASAMCRLRHSNIARPWVWLYVALFANACWYLYATVFETVAWRDAITIAMVAMYLHMTRSSWKHGVPAVAQRKPAHLRGAD